MSWRCFLFVLQGIDSRSRSLALSGAGRTPSPGLPAGSGSLLKPGLLFR